jgi:acetyl-CoA acyltransferase
MPEPVIIDCLRTPVGKAPRGTLRYTRPDDLAGAVLRRLLEKYPQVPRDDIDDVILGCAFPEAESGMNLARNAALLAGVPDSVPAFTINRCCASGLEAIAIAADRIRAGRARIALAGGAESMSLLPKAGHHFSPNPTLVDTLPEIYLSMGLTAERVRTRYGISRQDSDALALGSHQRAVRAQGEGRFVDEIVPLDVEGGVFTRDEGPRADSTLEALAKLKPVFHATGTVTAGNASQTSDGAAAALVMEEETARALGLAPLARFVSYAVAGVPPDIMGIGPVVAIPKALALAGLKLADIGLIELNEAFACQALAVILKAGLDPERVNVNGGAIALGHPLGATGAKLTATLVRELHRRQERYGMVTMCVGGGMGAAGIFERCQES